MTSKKNIVAIIIFIILSSTINSANAQLEAKYPNYKELAYKGLKIWLLCTSEYNKNKSYPLVLVLNGFY